MKTARLCMLIEIMYYAGGISDEDRCLAESMAVEALALEGFPSRQDGEWENSPGYLAWVESENEYRNK